MMKTVYGAKISDAKKKQLANSKSPNPGVKDKEKEKPVSKEKHEKVKAPVK